MKQVTTCGIRVLREIMYHLTKSNEKPSYLDYVDQPNMSYATRISSLASRLHIANTRNTVNGRNHEYFLV